MPLFWVGKFIHVLSLHFSSYRIIICSHWVKHARIWVKKTQILAYVKECQSVSNICFGTVLFLDIIQRCNFCGGNDRFHISRLGGY